MATIQIKRRTSAGTGPLTGTGTVKAGEPLIDLNGGNLYVSKADKIGTSSAPITAADYIEFYSKGNTDSLINSKINGLKLGQASKFNVGTTAGKIPVIDSDGKLKSDIIPQIAITDTFVVSSETEMLKLSSAQVGDVVVRTDINKSFILKASGYSTKSNWQELLTPSDKVSSVNGKTGAVTITLDSLNGASKTALSGHANNGTHLTEEQKLAISNMTICDIKCGSEYSGVDHSSTLTELNSKIISGGLSLYYSFNNGYKPSIKSVYLGIDKDKVLTPTSTIDGGYF